MKIDPVLLAFGATLLAGLSTGIGSLIALLMRKTSTRFLSVALGFSAGVMIYVSLVDMFPIALADLSRILGASAGRLATVLSFFGGMILIAVIDRLVPSVENPHEVRRVESMSEAPHLSTDGRTKMMRVGFMSALAITIHNFPEGIATFTATLQRPALGLVVALAIAIHNIPEGIAVAVPVYYATGSRKKAFRLSVLSGLAEPLGALVAYLFLASFLSDTVMGVLFAGIAGIMVFISLDELLPTAREYGSPHLAIYGLMAGMLVIAFSLLLFIPV